MKLFTCLALFLSIFTTGCGTQLALSGQAREDYLKSIKSYGQYFVKAGMTTESWRSDWVACGGRSDGQYSSDAQSGSTSAVLRAASDQKAQQLSNCMQSKGYIYQR